eukprot:gb/GECG01009917.1/.p1 GENE.gb/GECG01009917.1/~~gb/GECG01009917.1/.p1  ORF type:complete len:349 (+),score=32.38 gb/GECG01009917.1/:1-1047(+)
MLGFVYSVLFIFSNYPKERDMPRHPQRSLFTLEEQRALCKASDSPDELMRLFGDRFTEKEITLELAKLKQRYRRSVGSAPSNVDQFTDFVMQYERERLNQGEPEAPPASRKRPFEPRASNGDRSIESATANSVHSSPSRRSFAVKQKTKSTKNPVAAKGSSSTKSTKGRETFSRPRLQLPHTDVVITADMVFDKLEQTIERIGNECGVFFVRVHGYRRISLKELLTDSYKLNTSTRQTNCQYEQETQNFLRKSLGIIPLIPPDGHAYLSNFYRGILPLVSNINPHIQLFFPEQFRASYARPATTSSARNNTTTRDEVRNACSTDLGDGASSTSSRLDEENGIEEVTSV